MRKIFKNLDEIKRFTKPDDWWTEYFVKPLAARFVAFIQNTWITPNHVTILSFIPVLFACLFILSGNHAGFIMAAILIHAGYALDIADGLLARYKKEQSPFGGWMDGISDRIKEFLIILCLSLQLKPLTATSLFSGLYALFLIAMYHGFITTNLPAQKEQKKKPQKPGQLTLLNKIRHRSKLGFFNLGEQVFLYSLFLMLNKINLFFIVFSAYGTLWLISFSILRYKEYYTKDSYEDSQEKIKVLYIIDGMPFGGGTRAFLQLAQGLDKNKFEPFFCCMPGGILHKIIIESKIPYMPADFSRRFNPFLFFRLNRIIKKINPHIVHSQGGRADFYARISAWFRNVPVVFSTVAMLVENYDVSFIEKKVYAVMDRISRTCATHFIVVSEKLNALLMNSYRIPPEKISVVYNGVETDLYNPEKYNKQAVRKELGIAGDSVVVGSIGRLSYQKSYHSFLQAAAIVLALHPHALFILAGEGPLREELEALSQSLGIAGSIKFLGFRSDVPAILACLDIFVLSSIIEGNPIILLEAMAMGKPLVVTDIDGVKEAVSNGISAQIAAPGNPEQIASCIHDLISDPEKAGMMGRSARQQVQTRFDISTVITTHEKLYIDACN